MGFSGSLSAGIELGSWGWVTKRFSKDPYLFLAHMPPSHFSQPPHVQLEEVAHKIVLPLTGSLIYRLLPRLDHNNHIHTIFPFWWQNCSNRGED